MHLLDGEREGSRRYNFDAGAKRHVVSRKPCLSIFRLWRESMRFGKEQLYEGLGPRPNSYGFVHAERVGPNGSPDCPLEILKLRL
jgi:hypothetical protein